MKVSKVTIQYILLSPIVSDSVPFNFMANQQVPIFSWNNCVQSSRKTFMCPDFHTHRVLKYTKCHISTNWLSFLKSYVYHIAKNYLPLLQQIADWLKIISPVGTQVSDVNCWTICTPFIAITTLNYQKPI